MNNATTRCLADAARLSVGGSASRSRHWEHNPCHFTVIDDQFPTTPMALFQGATRAHLSKEPT